MRHSSDSSETQKTSEWWGPVFLVCLLVVLTAGTWRRWGDILIDLPLHLYTPWRLSLGDILYRDVINLHGPFSETYHGFLFRLFGASVNTLIAASLGLLAAQVALLYLFFKREADTAIATLICTVFLVGFAFANLIGIGNYNYVLPYNYELIHGLFFATCTLLLLGRWAEGINRKRELLMAGFFFGVAALTKQEITLALTLGVAAAFLLDMCGRARIACAKAFAGFVAAALIPPIFFWAKFAMSLGTHEAFRIMAWPWTALLSTSASNNAFHRAGLGLDDPMENLAATIQAAGLGALLLLATVAICHRRLLKWIPIGGGLLLLGFAGSCDWREAGRGLPILMVIALPLLISRPRVLIWCVFGLAMLAKMGINCRIWHYGYVLAMPASIGLVFVLLKALPDWVENHGFKGNSLKLILAAILCVGTIRLGTDSWQIYRAKSYSFGSGADRMLTFPPQLNSRAEPIEQTVAWLKANTPPEATLAAFPQGVILNFLAKRANPTPYLTWIVTEYNTYGESRMLGSLQAHRPDYIALVHTDTSEYGPRFFGQPGYGAETMEWINANYQCVFLAGAEPFHGPRFGIKLLKLKTPGRAVPAPFPPRHDGI